MNKNKELLFLIKNSKKESNKLKIKEEDLLFNILNEKELDQRVLEFLIDNKIHLIKTKEISSITSKYPMVIFCYQELNILLISSLFFLNGYIFSLCMHYLLNGKHILISLSLFMPIAFLMLVYHYCFRWYKEKESLLKEITEYKKEKNQRVTEYSDNFNDY
jgi:Ca2+-dependent lipid-binding protein